MLVAVAHHSPYLGRPTQGGGPAHDTLTLRCARLTVARRMSASWPRQCPPAARLARRPMSPTRILILSDGRPGHYNLSEGIAAAIERLGPAETARVDVRRGRWPGAVLAGLVRARLPAPLMLRFV